MEVFDDEVKGQLQLYRVIVTYQYKQTDVRSWSDHIIRAASPDEALNIADKHSMGLLASESLEILHRKLWKPVPYCEQYIRDAHKGRIWFEGEDGKLKYE